MVEKVGLACLTVGICVIFYFLFLFDTRLPANVDVQVRLRSLLRLLEWQRNGVIFGVSLCVFGSIAIVGAKYKR